MLKRCEVVKRPNLPGRRSEATKRLDGAPDPFVKFLYILDFALWQVQGGDQAVAAGWGAEPSAARSMPMHPYSRTLFREPGRAFSLAARCCHAAVRNMVPLQAFITDCNFVCREATKQLRLDGEPDPSAARSMLMHPSVAAVLAWRYSQLLSALPKRCEN